METSNSSASHIPLLRRPQVRIALALLPVAILIAWPSVAPTFQRFMMEYRDARVEERIKDEYALLREMERNDHAGSTTPVGTLNLLIEALAQNDPKTASTYFEVLEQENAYDRLIGQKNSMGDLSRAHDFYTYMRDGSIKCDSSEVTCHIERTDVRTQDEYVQLAGTTSPVLLPKGSQSRSYLKFKLNSSTLIWKISD